MSGNTAPLAASFSSSDDETPSPPPPIKLVLAAESTNHPTVDNYDLDNNDDYTLSEKMVHYLGGHVMPDHWLACKACLVFMAGCMLVGKLAPMSKATMQNTCLEGYRSLVSKLDPTYHGDDARAFFLASFRNKHKLISGELLYCYFQDSRSKMQSHLVPLLPKEFMTMKSGRGYHETCHNVIVANFCKEYVQGTNNRLAMMTQSEADQLTPPQFWEYKKPPWTFFLCVKIFRRHPQLAPNVVEVLDDVANRPVTEAGTKRKAQIAAYEKRNKENKQMMIKQEQGNAVDNILIAQNQKKALWAKVVMAKAMAESANVTRKLGEIDAHKRNLNLLERYRHDVIGENVYNARVLELLTSMPSPKSFADNCAVICIDGDDDAICERQDSPSNKEIRGDE